MLEVRAIVLRTPMLRSRLWWIATFSGAAAQHRNGFREQDVDEDELVACLLKTIEQGVGAIVLGVAFVKPGDEDVRVQRHLSHRTGCCNRLRRHRPRSRGHEPRVSIPSRAWLDALLHVAHRR
jgi:hypothetical protein